jgi:hypothetical protein
MVEALVYVSREYKDDGSIRAEYIARMEKAVTDGRKMGLSDRCLNHIDRTIHQEGHHVRTTMPFEQATVLTREWKLVVQAMSRTRSWKALNQDWNSTNECQQFGPDMQRT